MLCVQTEDLPRSVEVCRKVDIDHLLRSQSDHFYNEAEAHRDHYEPLEVGISVRSLYDNTVLGVRDDAGGVRYCHTMTDIGYAVHKGYDLLMYLSSLLFLRLVEYSSVVEKTMFQHSQIQPIGLYYPPGAHHPLLYSHVIMSDPGMKLLTPHFKPEVTVTPIQTLTAYGDPSALIKTLVIVKEEHQ